MTNPNIETDPENRFNQLDKRIDKLENNLTTEIRSVNDLPEE